ncbi:MAG TPA: ATP-binding cassette domain-containing protein [Pirellulales bacterium]|jgi:ABC-type multidrug transport system fused ATPase/permease subunit|nr:ATP-binding cassette domain-containing protein [Pirellulales bacterium]
MHWNSFHRARRFGPPPLGMRLAVYGSSLLAAALMVLLIVALGAIADLATSRGNLSIDARAKEQLQEIERLSGSPDASVGEQVRYDGRGLLPAVWRLHGTWLGKISDGLYASWPALQRNDSCVPAIVVTGWCLSLLLAVALYLLERSARVSTRNAVQRLRLALYQQSVQLGAGDLLLGQRQSVVELFVDRVEALARGLVRWSRAVPLAVVLLLLLAVTAMYVDFWLTLAAILLAVLSRLMLEGLRNSSKRRGTFWADVAAQQCDTLVEDLQQARSLGNFAPATVLPGGSVPERLQHCHAASVRQHISPAVNEPAVLMFVLFGAWLILLLAGLNVLRDPPRVLFAGTVVLGASVVSMVFPLRLLQRLLQELPEADRAAADIMGYLDRQPSVGQVPEAKPITPPMKQLALVNVRLSDAAGMKLLDDVSLTIPCGSRTAVIASDRETPFAVAGLLPRFYDPTAGRVLFDGQEIGRGTLASLRGHVGLLLPGRILATGTVSENISGGDPRYSAREVIEAARQALAYDFIQKLPHGFDTVVGEHGLHLSAPEAMLLGVARILIHDPAVAILGETADRYDATTEDTLNAATGRLAAGRTLIVLARRLATLRSVERILLFHEGKLHADGSHGELLEQSELYRHLNYVRFNEFRNQVSGDW